MRQYGSIPPSGFNENGEIVVPDCVRGALGPLVGQIDALDEAIGAIESDLAVSVKADTTAKRLIPYLASARHRTAAWPRSRTQADSPAGVSRRLLDLTPRQN